MVKPIPEGYHSITPYLIVKGGADAIDFYKQAFNASEVMRLDAPDGKIGHAEIKIGNSMVMLADENPQMGASAPASAEQWTVGMCLYVEDADAVVAQAVEAGARVQRPIQDQFYGDRSATLEDPFGHVWTVATHVEDVTPEEIEKRMAAMMSNNE